MTSLCLRNDRFESAANEKICSNKMEKQTVKELLPKPVEDVENINKEFSTAVLNGDIEIVKKLINQATNFNEALVYAVDYSFNVDIVRSILEKATKFDEAIHRARMYNRTEMFRMIMKRKKQLKEKKR